MSGHVRDLWTIRSPNGGRRIHGPRWGKGKRWQAVVIRPDGSRATSTHETRRAADLWVARAQTERQLVAPRVAFDAAADEWVRAQHQMRPQSRDAAQSKIDRMLKPALAGVALGDITRPMLQAVANDLAASYSPASVRVAWSHLRGILTTAHMDGLIDSIPTVGVKLPRASEERIIPLTDEQVRTLLRVMPDRVQSMVLLGATSGLRPGELAGLTWDRITDTSVRVDRQLLAVDAGSPVFGPPKSKAGFRTVGVGPDVIARLVAHRERYGEGPAGLVFVSPRGRPMDRALRQDVWARYRHEIGGQRGQSWHQLRHYHASKLIAAGMSVVAVAARLGHRDVTETLSTYAHLWPGDEASMETVAASIAGILSAR